MICRPSRTTGPSRCSFGACCEHADDGFVAIPLTHPQMRQHSIQVQTMAGRALPPSVKAFRDHLIAEIGGAKPSDAAAPKPARKCGQTH
ncbi:hypothetical protein AYM40_11520 [Paraburkholderia phytofirmans OLGA172]|uniref:LysR substrate-binding domain-containing protein n=1 Tax=Paraburkholderia phytofirmans OLGA172 TaxID=1417228 RepID=A0A167VZI2_9BURK|nr:hypothetical protein AYM40_11520 [Paraburkholderia phytofirmans OLGA172]